MKMYFFACTLSRSQPDMQRCSSLDHFTYRKTRLSQWLQLWSLNDCSTVIAVQPYAPQHPYKKTLVCTWFTWRTKDTSVWKRCKKKKKKKGCLCQEKAGLLCGLSASVCMGVFSALLVSCLPKAVNFPVRSQAQKLSWILWKWHWARLQCFPHAHLPLDGGQYVASTVIGSLFDTFVMMLWSHEASHLKACTHIITACL